MRVCPLIIVGFCISIIVIIGIQALDASAQTVNVTVNAASSLGVIPPYGHGVNTNVNIGNMADPALPEILESAGVNAMRYPGGITSDTFHWQPNTTIVPDGSGGTTTTNQPSSNDFDGFMALANAAGAMPVITVNYGSNETCTGGGDPNEAAAWVAYAKLKGYNAKYWEIGNEQYDNDEYAGVNSELDLHSSHSPVTYGQNVAVYAAAMKAQDSTIKIGAILDQPGSFPDDYAPDWNSSVLSQCGSSIDFVILHYYPATGASDSQLLGCTAAQIPLLVSQTRALINRYCGSNAGNVQIFVTETNSSGMASTDGKQVTNLVDALFMADETQTWFENGIANVDEFNLVSGMYVTWPNGVPTVFGNLSSSLYGNNDYCDCGLLAIDTYSGYLPGTDTMVSEPADDTPFPSYYGEEMIGILGGPGDTMVASSSSQPLLVIHAVRNATGNLSVMLINESPSATYSANVNVAGYASSWSAPCETYFYGENSSSITSTKGSAGSTFSESLPPYSITTVVMTPQATAPTFGASVTTPPSAAPGATSNIDVSIEDSGAALSGGTVNIDVYNLAGSLVSQKTFTGQNWTSGGTNPYTYAWPAPSVLTTYYVCVAVSNSSGSLQYYWGSNLAVIMVTSSGSAPTTPSFSITGTVSPSTASPGQSVTVTLSYKDTCAALTDGTVLAQSYLGSGVQYPQSWANQNWVYGQTNTYTYTWIAPTYLGAYNVEGGVIAPDYSTTYDNYNNDITTINVQGATPAYTGTSYASNPTIVEGSSTTIYATMTDTGGPLSNGVTEVGVYNSSGLEVSYSSYSDQVWTAGESISYQYTWTAPSTPGTYGVYLGMDDTSGDCWTWYAGPTITVLASAPEFTATMSASPTSVAPGATTTISATVTDFGGALPNGITEMGIYNERDQEVGQTAYSNQVWNTGTSLSYQYVWTVPTTPGTYTVYFGMDDTSGDCWTWLTGPTITVT